ncbi:universal stress protein [Blastococcus deserti]|uniref:Universal stress protein n=1 Tax=Blastococcus deserti TaxID=2259033 RepID=A0ABW4X9K4_9ACTN
MADPAFARAVLPITRRIDRLAAPLVVGVTADGSSAAAVEWAATAAAAQQRRLRIVHSFPAPLVLDPLGVVPAADSLPVQLAAATRLLDAELARARSIAPGVDASAYGVRGSPRRVLLRESRDAHLLVLGSRRRPRPGVPRLVPGSVRLRVTASAGCPVVVIRPSGDAVPERALPRVVLSRVIVGIDGLPHSDGAVGFAFRTAFERGLPLTALHAWAADCPADLEAVTAPLVTTEAAAYALVDGAVAGWRQVYPEVRLCTAVVRRDPCSALIGASAGAALVVVGARGRRARLGPLVRSVSRALLEGAAGPVAVVRRGTQPSAPEVHRWAAR